MEILKDIFNDAKVGSLFSTGHGVSLMIDGKWSKLT